MDDTRFQWFKQIIYKTLSIDLADPAFEELIERNEFANKCFTNFISGSNKTKTGIFLYCTVEEEEVEVEDTSEQAEESEKFAGSVSSESEKSDSENASIDEKIEAKSPDNAEDTHSEHTVVKSDSPEAVVGPSQKKRLSRRSTTSLLQIIKKNVLHVCLNITSYVSSQRYLYILQCELMPIPAVDTLEEAFKIMLDYFELGSINQHPLISMNRIISQLYSHILADEKWLPLIPPTECKMEENQLSTVLSEFRKDLKEFLVFTEETILQIEEPVMFNAPNIITSCTVEELAQERSFVAEAEESANEWTESISELLEKTVKKNPPENNLLGEIKFWQRQKLVLSTCYDHLSKSSIQKTVEILITANSDISKFQEKVKEVEKHLKTATDNFSYLSLLHPLAQNLLPEKSFEDAQKAVEDIFMLLKMVWIQSNYYREVSNMCRLIKGIAMLLKEKVKRNADVETLFRKPLPEILRIVTNSSELLKFWKQQYLKECENVKRYGGLYWWGFEITVFFTETDHMILVCSDLEKVTMMLEELYNIFNTNLKFFVRDVKGLNVLEVRVFGITSRIQYSNFDIYDPQLKSEWKAIIETFHRDVKNLEDEIKLFIGKMFRLTLSWENAYILTNSFNKISISPTIRDFINKSRDDMLKQFIREIYEKENEFLTFKDEPPSFPGVPDILSSIIWVQDLLQKLSRPVSQICDNASKKEMEVMQRFKKTESLLKEYKLEKYEDWKVAANEVLNKFLQEKVLKQFKQVSSSDPNDFYKVLAYRVNFPIYLEEVSTEAKLLEYHGYEIPTFIKNAILQEQLYYEHRHNIRITLVSLRKCLATLTEDEISILAIPFENLCSVLDLGLNDIQWESVEIFDFVKKVKRAVSVFRSLVSQIKNVFLEIDKRIDSLAECDLFKFNICDPENIPTCEEFFNDAESEMEMKVGKIVAIHSSLQLLLKNVETITCKTATGEAIQMTQYYHRCEEQILKSLLKMTLKNLEYFKEEILENYIFPYFELAYHSEDEFVRSSLTRAELIFITFLQNAVESTRKVIRWFDGTCKPSSPFYVSEVKEQMEFSFYLDISMHSKVKDLVVSIINSFFNFMNKMN